MVLDFYLILWSTNEFIFNENNVGVSSIAMGNIDNCFMETAVTGVDKGPAAH